MIRESNFVRLLIALLLVGLSANAGNANQQGAKPLVNADVVRMAGAGLGEGIVIAAIEQAKEVTFDLSPDALVSLKKGGVPESVIAAMLAKGSAPAQRASSSTNTMPSGAEPVRPRLAPGIYLSKSTSGAIDDVMLLEPTVITRVRSRGGWGTALSGGIAKTDMIAEIRGSRASLRTQLDTPTFYFVFATQSTEFAASPFVGWLASASSPNEFVLLQMYVERDRRELVVGSGNAYSRTTGVESENTVPMNIERLGPGFYKVVPSEPLGPGEFSWFYAAGVGTLQSGGMAGKLFDFGVTRQ